MAALQPLIQGQQEPERDFCTPAEFQVTAPLSAAAAARSCRRSPSASGAVCLRAANPIASSTAQDAWQVEDLAAGMMGCGCTGDSCSPGQHCPASCRCPKHGPGVRLPRHLGCSCA